MTERLVKSKSSALILSALTSLVFASVSATLNILLPFWLTGDVHSVIASPENLSEPGQVAALIGILFCLFVMLVGIGAAWLYRFFGEAYFGSRGAWRWMLFGLSFALLSQVGIWLFPENNWMDWIWPIGSVVGAFFLSRWVIPLKKKAGEGA
jgi:hypothetical protein